MKRILSFFITLALTVSFININAFASQYYDISLNQEDLQSDAYETIESALKQAKENASENLVYRIYVPKGDYILNSGLHIYSNTQLLLSPDTVLYKTFESGNMLKAGVREEHTSGYDGYKNIVVDGGVWNSGYVGDSCAMRFAHCSNLTVSNLTITNIKNAHHIEVAAVDGFNLQGCNFSGTERTTESSAEAVQIDIMHSYEHFPDYYEYDDTPCKNVTVSGCTFSDVYSGVGTRSGVVGSYFENINIVNNTFTNIEEKAVSCMNYRNSKISGNVINNATMGIVFEYLPALGVSERLYMPNDSSNGIKIVNSSMSEISSNIINVGKNVSSFYSCGIFVYGSKADNALAKEENIIAGDYSVKNISVKNNTVNCYHSESRGVFFTGVINSELVSNSINDYANANSGINGVNLCGSSKNTISSNAINGTFNNGFSLYSNDRASTASRSNGFFSNSVNGIKSYGVRVAGNSTATIKNSNSFYNCGIYPIYISSQPISQSIGNVAVKSIVRSGRGKAMLRWKPLEGAEGYKIYRSYTPYGNYKQIATVRGNNKTHFEDKSSRFGFTYYYRISPYKTANSSVIIGEMNAENVISL